MSLATSRKARDEYLENYALRFALKYFYPAHPIIREIRRRFERAKSPSLHARMYYDIVDAGNVKELRGIVLSGKEKHPPSELVHTYKNLQGKYVKIPAKFDYHKVSISPFRMKCNCQDALITSSRADNRLTRIFHRPMTIASRYVLCKHTIAFLPVALKNHVITYDEAKLLMKRAVLIFILGRSNIRIPYKDIDYVLGLSQRRVYRHGGKYNYKSV